MKVKHLIWVFAICFLLSLVGVIAYMSQHELQLGERLGSGIFYLKGYYEVTEQVGTETRTAIVTDQGIGFITIPLVISVVITAAAGMFVLSRKKSSVL